MCVIIDANMAGTIFAVPPPPDAKPVLRWLLKGDGILVHGGKLTGELNQMEGARKTLIELKKLGKAIDVAAEAPGDFATAEKLCEKKCKSNDSHIVALARISGARTLITNDQCLMDDFRNTDLIPRPKGKVYQRAAHDKLLAHTDHCRGLK
jgi:hypothetical protein